MSSALPGFIMPTVIENQCFIDGGVLDNYPINYCLRDHPLEHEIIGININDDNNENSNLIASKESSLLDYVYIITKNAINYIKKTVKKINIKNTVYINNYYKLTIIDFFKKSLLSQELRNELFEKGVNEAIIFLQNIVQDNEDYQEFIEDNTNL
jgi:predicted acylesterase/phospholipase RssA